jgi:hypothetical protein
LEHESHRRRLHAGAEQYTRVVGTQLLWTVLIFGALCGIPLLLVPLLLFGIFGPKPGAKPARSDPPPGPTQQ